MNPTAESIMPLAIREAEQSLREGNNGFGAVIAKDGEIVAVAHDTEETDQDPTAHAELNAIRQASARLGKDLSGCLLVATHEPCPMCAIAIVWARIGRVAVGYSIAEAIGQGRRRIDLPCETIFSAAGADVAVERGVARASCAVLYDRSVRNEVRRLRGAGPEEMAALNDALARRRLEWFAAQGVVQGSGQDPGPAPARWLADSPLESAYRMLLDKFGVSAAEMPVVERSATRIVFHSMNFCPTLEACRILRLDTRRVCAACNEEATDRLVKRIDPRLRFARNYGKLRPHAPYCEESISLDALA
ncbi:MAG: nucleoside deaminase [Desulfovibrionaceae bacterium]|nr:nucleoside deaminase [Desulfovibrionaceae bacterium]